MCGCGLFFSLSLDRAPCTWHKHQASCTMHQTHIPCAMLMSSGTLHMAQCTWHIYQKPCTWHMTHCTWHIYQTLCTWPQAPSTRHIYQTSYTWHIMHGTRHHSHGTGPISPSTGTLMSRGVKHKMKGRKSYRKESNKLGSSTPQQYLWGPIRGKEVR